jgi:hypothetical protein
LVAAICWHVCTLLTPAWVKASKESHGRDFASYYYGVKVAAAGEDPYIKANLDRAARADKTRKSVFPYFYPPTFLLPMAWVQPLELASAYRLWFWLDELFLLGAVWVLWRWWRPLGPTVGAMLAATLALFTAIPNNHLMGQVNIPVLTMVLGGLYIARKEANWAQALGGGLLGLACMMKMSPGLVVAWCLLHRRFKVVAAACLTAVLLSVMTLPLMSADLQIRFYTEVLPQFASGDYNGLSVPIGMFGNHSIPNVFHQLAGGGAKLSSFASGASSVCSLLLIGGLGWLFRKPPQGLIQEGAQLGAVCGVMLLVPVYTYEHHMVWLIPSVLMCAVGLVEGRLSARWAPAVCLAVAAWMYDLADLKQFSLYVNELSPVLSFLVRELKFAALLVLVVASIKLGIQVVASDEPVMESQ